MNWDEELTKELAKDTKTRRIFAIIVFILCLVSFMFAMAMAALNI